MCCLLVEIDSMMVSGVNLLRKQGVILSADCVPCKVGVCIFSDKTSKTTSTV